MESNGTNHDTHNTFLEHIRIAELCHIEEVLGKYSKSGARILEVGAGTGWQAKSLSALGYDVQAIDIPNSNHSSARIWPIIDYDGQNIPFPDKSFDIVYSSNVLEHVTYPESLNNEIHRVLHDDGLAIHFVPTTVWRIWSLLAFYPALLKDTFERIFRKTPLVKAAQGEKTISAVQQRSFVTKLLWRIVPHAHGASETIHREVLVFRRKSWKQLFENFNWNIISYRVNGLFLTGDMLLGSRLSVKRRQLLSHIFGSTAHLYVLKKTPPIAAVKAQNILSADSVLESNYASWLPNKIDAKILDLGCGNGRMLHFLSAHNFCKITGVDRDEQTLMQIPKLPGVTLECVEVDSSYLERHPMEFDLIILKQMLYYISSDKIMGFMNALRDSLKTDGIVIVEFFNAALISSRFTELKDPFIRTAFTEHSIRRLIEANGMKIIEMYGERRASPKRLRSWIYIFLRHVWITILKSVYILERGIDQESPRIFTKSIVAVAKRK